MDIIVFIDITAMTIISMDTVAPIDTVISMTTIASIDMYVITSIVHNQGLKTVYTLMIRIISIDIVIVCSEI